MPQHGLPSAHAAAADIVPSAFRKLRRKVLIPGYTMKAVMISKAGPTYSHGAILPCFIIWGT
jgi:hypothetical protein